MIIAKDEWLQRKKKKNMHTAAMLTIFEFEQKQEKEKKGENCTTTCCIYTLALSSTK